MLPAGGPGARSSPRVGQTEEAEATRDSLRSLKALLAPWGQRLVILTRSGQGTWGRLLVRARPMAAPSPSAGTRAALSRGAGPGALAIDFRSFRAACAVHGSADHVGRRRSTGCADTTPPVEGEHGDRLCRDREKAGGPPCTFTSMMSCDSGSEVNPENGMSFVTPNVCLEASSFEREWAPRTTWEDSPRANLTNTGNRSHTMTPAPGEQRGWRRSPAGIRGTGNPSLNEGCDGH